MRTLASLTLLLAAITWAGCSQETPGPSDSGEAAVDPAAESLSPTVNTHCPIMGGEVTPEGGTVEWNGQTVGFCCSDCIAKFEALSDEEKQAALEKAEHAHGDHDHGDHDHGEHDHGDGEHDHGEEGKETS